MDKETIITSSNKFVDEVLKRFSPSSIILYGSYANGSARESSDIDIAVVFDRYPDSILDGMKSLYRLRRDVDDRIEPILLEKCNDKSGFYSHVLKTGQVLYSNQ